jgi:hypothetical protein
MKNAGTAPKDSDKKRERSGKQSLSHHCREVLMPRFNRQFLMITLPLTAAFGFAAPSDALAQKKPSYEKAWADCKAQIDRTIAADQQTSRASAGAGCMRKYGYRLKKKS